MPSDALSLEQIVNTAIQLLDEEGLEGLNLRALGKRLGSVPAAVYWHIRNKRDLIRLAGDKVFSEVALPDLDVTDWKTAASAMAMDFGAMLRRHPWVVQVVGSYVVYGPGKARHDDHNIAIYEAAGFKGGVAEQAAATVLAFALGNALNPAAEAVLRRQLIRGGGDAERLMDNTVNKARAVALQFPHLRARLENARPDDRVNSEDGFEFGLRIILDGLEARLAQMTKQGNRRGVRRTTSRPSPRRRYR